MDKNKECRDSFSALSLLVATRKVSVKLPRGIYGGG